MKMRLTESCELNAPLSAVWDVLTDNGRLTMFSGFGPIPGIASARWIRGEAYAVGSVREVLNTDRSIHFEEVLTAQEPNCVEDRIYGFTSPFRFLVREATDRFELGQRGSGTLLARTFTAQLTTPLAAPIVLLIMVAFRRALRRHHGALRTLFGKRVRGASTS